MRLAGLRPYIREGIAALYTFTPFKVIYVKKRGKAVDYILTLLEPYGFVALVKDKKGRTLLNDIWYKRKKVAFRVPVMTKYGYPKFITIFSEYPAFYVHKEGKRRILIIDEDVFRYIEGDLDENEARELLKKKARMRPCWFEYSFQSLSMPKVCELGIVGLSSEDSCPLLNICPYVEVSQKVCHHYIDIYSELGETYSGVYKVYPVFDYYVYYNEMATEDLFALLGVKGEPLAFVKFISNISAVLWYDQIVLTSKRNITAPIRLKVPSTFKTDNGKKFYTPGLNIPSTYGFAIEFDKESLKNIIRNAIRKDETVKCWLSFKYKLWYDLGKRGKSIFNSWNFLRELINDIATDNSRAINKLKGDIHAIPEDDLVHFGSLVLIHSLAHLIVEGLQAYFGLTSYDIIYFIEHDLIREGIYHPKVLFFEGRPGGLGYLLRFKDREKMHDFILNTFKSYVNETSSHREQYIITQQEVRNILEKVKKLADEYREQVKDRTLINNMSNIVLKSYDVLSRQLGVYPHIYATRLALLDCIRRDIIKYEPRERSLIREFLRELIELLPDNFDGGIQCLILEEGCMMSPFEQPFTVSISLLYKVLKELLEETQDLKVYTHMKGKIWRSLRSWFNHARREVKIETSDFTLNKDLKKTLRRLDERNVVIKLLIGMNAPQEESTKKL